MTEAEARALEREWIEHNGGDVEPADEIEEAEQIAREHQRLVAFLQQQQAKANG